MITLQRTNKVTIYVHNKGSNTMNTYNQFEVLNIGEEARIKAITYKVLDRED